MQRIFVVLLLLTCFGRAFGQYPLLDVPTPYRGPSGEDGQILVDGLATKVALYYAHFDDEADWHVYIHVAPEVSRDLINALRGQHLDIEECDLEVYSELMTVDKYKKAWLFGDDKFYSADFTSSFLLSKPGSAHPAWDFGLQAQDDQGTEINFCRYSGLIGGRVYLQGALVNDSEHGTRVEIHPLDSIAFAMDETGRPISAKRGEPAWPRTYVNWRVGVFANSKLHRINKESYLKKERTTTWYLDLPRDAVGGDPNTPGNITVTEKQLQLWDGGHNVWYSGRRWQTLVPWTIAVDPKDGRKKLKITTTMLTPDKFGGIIVRDYTIRVNPISPTGAARR
jgi:hypothetical protein